MVIYSGVTPIVEWDILQASWHNVLTITLNSREAGTCRSYSMWQAGSWWLVDQNHSTNHTGWGTAPMPHYICNGLVGLELLTFFPHINCSWAACFDMFLAAAFSFCSKKGPSFPLSGVFSDGFKLTPGVHLAVHTLPVFQACLCLQLASSCMEM